MVGHLLESYRKALYPNGGDLSASFDLMFSVGLAFFFMERSDQSAKLYGRRNVPLL
jgi:hypothetical protein